MTRVLNWMFEQNGQAADSSPNGSRSVAASSATYTCPMCEKVLPISQKNTWGEPYGNLCIKCANDSAGPCGDW